MYFIEERIRHVNSSFFVGVTNVVVLVTPMVAVVVIVVVDSDVVIVGIDVVDACFVTAVV